MPRATGNDLCELFGYAPDDTSLSARKQWKSQECPFAGGTCIKHSHPGQDGDLVIYGTCSVINKTHNGNEEVIICPQRLYANKYETLRICAEDAFKTNIPVFSAEEFSQAKSKRKIPADCVVMLGKNCGKEVSISNPGVIELSLDWVLARLLKGQLASIVPCEVQSIDITGNYREVWRAYSKEKTKIPDSDHGMNWANVWKRLIPQLILKASVASTSKLCKHGLYFIVPDRVYLQFEKLVGEVPQVQSADAGVLTVMTYRIGPSVPNGQIRSIIRNRTMRMLSTEFAKSFASGKQLPLGTQLDSKVSDLLAAL